MWLEGGVTPTTDPASGLWVCGDRVGLQPARLALHSYLLLLTLATIATALACLKYDSTNRDAKWSLVCVFCLSAVWSSWLVLINLLEPRYRDPVCVMALTVSALTVLLSLYARKLYEFTEFGRADTKLELMSNIMLSDSPTDSQSGSRIYSQHQQGSAYSAQHHGGTYGSNILPGIIAMPEFEDNSILGDSVYQHLQFQEREGRTSQVDMKMFEQQQQLQGEVEQQERYLAPDSNTDGESVGQSEEGEWSRDEIYQSISRGHTYKELFRYTNILGGSKNIHYQMRLDLF